MTHPHTPREKVRKAIIDVMKPRDADVTLGRIDSCTDAILTAIASGSGDHAELARDDADCDTCDGAGEVEARIGFGTDYVPCPECVSRENRIERDALIAEVAALRGGMKSLEIRRDFYKHNMQRAEVRTAEAERKLAEAVEDERARSQAIINERDQWIVELIRERDAAKAILRDAVSEAIPDAMIFAGHADAQRYSKALDGLRIWTDRARTFLRKEAERG